MKLKIGPVEIEQDSIKDDILFNEFKESPKEVEKYLLEKSKYFDLTLKNTIAGKTMKMITDFVLGLAGGIFFLGWSFYVFYSSRDVFVWQEMNVSTAFSVFLESLMILFICLLPVILILSFLKILKYFSNRKLMKQLELEEQMKKEKKTSK